MKKIIILIIKVILQKNKNITFLFLFSFYLISYGQEDNSSKIEDFLGIELNENDKQIELILTNKKNDTISVSNLYHYDNSQKNTYLLFYWFDSNEKIYRQGGIINIVEEPVYLLNSKNQRRMVKIPPKTKVYYPLGYFGSIRMFLEFQTIISYRGKNYFLKGRTNEIEIK